MKVVSEDLEMQEIKHAAEIEAVVARLEELNQKQVEIEQRIAVEEKKEGETMERFQMLQNKLYLLNLEMNRQAAENVSFFARNIFWSRC